MPIGGFGYNHDRPCGSPANAKLVQGWLRNGSTSPPRTGLVNSFFERRTIAEGIIQSRQCDPKSLRRYNLGMSTAAGKSKGRLRDLAFMAASCSHLLAWIAFAILVFVPIYQGESVSATSSAATSGTASSGTATSGELIRGQPEQVTTTLTATLLEVNGWSVLPFVLAPVAISGAGLLGVILGGRGRVLRRAPLGISALLLLGFFIAGSLSIGMFYLPAALAMAVSWAVSLGQRRERAVSS